MDLENTGNVYEYEKPSWIFHEITPKYKNREAMQGEFFAANTDLESLIREAVQNSLDAKVDKNSPNPVEIRINFSKAAACIIDKYFKDAWSHFEADSNGLRKPLPNIEEFPYITIEDFNTTGLTGAIDQFFEKSGTDNSFYHFFRAEGQSGKENRDIGRWGVGKYAFPKNSLIKSFFALTVRIDDNCKYLAGQSVLKSHLIDNTPYTPDGWFGHCNEDDLLLPISNNKYIENFISDFGITRNNEPGLSVVVPFVQNYTDTDIINGIIKNFYYAVVNKKLIIKVNLAELPPLEINENSILDIASKYCSDKETIDAVSLAYWGQSCQDDDFYELLPSTEGRSELKWHGEMIPAEMRKNILNTLSKSGKIAVRVPMVIKPASDDNIESFFKVFMQKKNEYSNPPIFFREGIWIPDACRSSISGYLALVVIEETGVAKMLGDSENPSHRSWLYNTEGFRDKYKYNSMHISFVTSSVNQIVKFISDEDKNLDRDFLSDVFFIEDPEDKGEGEKPNRKKGRKKENLPIPQLPKKPSRYSFKKLKNGFQVIPGERKFTEPFIINLKIYYDTIRGAKKYNKCDFRVDRDIEVNNNGVSFLKRKGNILKFKVNKPDFYLSAKGFDTQRDLRIDINAQEIKDA